MRKQIDPEPAIVVLAVMLLLAMMIWAIMASTPDPNCEGRFIGHVIQVGATCRQ